MTTEPMPAPESGGGKRDLLHDRKALALIGVAVVAVGAAGYFVVLPMLGGSKSSTTASGAVPHGKSRTSASATPSGTATGAAGLATPAPALNVRDPFSPLYTAPSAAPSATSAVPAPAGSVASPATQPQTIVIVESGGAATTTTTGGGTTATGGKPKYSLTLVRANGTSGAQVRLNGRLLTLSNHQSFPDSTNGPFMLDREGADDKGAVVVFEYGDSLFQLHQGETQLEG